MKDYIQPPDDLVLIEQELQLSLKEYVVVCRDNRKSSPIQYLKVNATSDIDAVKETKKIVPDEVEILKVYPSK
jgi:hypothetical protein